MIAKAAIISFGRPKSLRNGSSFARSWFYLSEQCPNRLVSLTIPRPVPDIPRQNDKKTPASSHRRSEVGLQASHGHYALRFPLHVEFIGSRNLETSLNFWSTILFESPLRSAARQPFRRNDPLGSIFPVFIRSLSRNHNALSISMKPHEKMSVIPWKKTRKHAKRNTGLA
uniref:Uncharacterized protein n=1 Tax=Candidatus Kentrum sp. TC TaxID=2126339 RepID=A0A450ZHA3_9GAMM|nr:MAG: hypothetical protein BECKTC1821F_GA0114240_100219 [Candidatus Kentron sp. TC]